MFRAFNPEISLKTQIYGLIISMTMLSFFLRVISDIDTTRDYLQSQLASHAQNTATSLGLSIAPYSTNDTLALARTMATAIFDSGYYSEIRFIDKKNAVLFTLQNPNRVESVPQWFMSYVKLEALTMRSEINNGWQLAGTLEVTSHLGESYITLWTHAKRSVVSSLILLFIALAIAYCILQTIFKPLKTLERQAQSVIQKRFILNDDLPQAQELRTVTAAVNKMILNLQSAFATMSKQNPALTFAAYNDTLTQVGNRRLFASHFNMLSRNKAPDSPLSAIIITLPSLRHINQSVDYEAGDDYIMDVIKAIRRCLSPLRDYPLFRVNGDTFIFLVTYNTHALYNLQTDLVTLFQQKKCSIHTNGYANSMVVNINTNTPVNDLLSLLDSKDNETQPTL
jgi:GGDEF domain-containing protein